MRVRWALEEVGQPYVLEGDKPWYAQRLPSRADGMAGSPEATTAGSSTEAND